MKSGCTRLPRALCGPSVPSNLAHCQATGPGRGVIPKGTLKKSCRSLNCICLYHFGREGGGNSREQFFKEKSHSWTGLPEKHLFFFFLVCSEHFRNRKPVPRSRQPGGTQYLCVRLMRTRGYGWEGGGTEMSLSIC